MTTAILTQEQIDSLTYAECRTALKRLEREHRLDTPWNELTREEWDLCDQVGNTLIGLEDRIRLFEDSRVQSMDPKATTITTPEPKLAKTGPKRKEFRVEDRVYPDAQTAAKKLGIKLGTLRTYVTRYPGKYGYVD